MTKLVDGTGTGALATTGNSPSDTVYGLVYWDDGGGVLDGGRMTGLTLQPSTADPGTVNQKGMWIGDVNDFTMDHCIIRPSFHECVYSSAGGSNPIGRWQFFNNRFIGTSGSSLCANLNTNMSQARELRIEVHDNIFEHANFGCSMQCNDFLIANNYFIDCGTAIYIGEGNSIRRGIVTGNVIVRPGTDGSGSSTGIKIAGGVKDSSGILVSGNAIYDVMNGVAISCEGSATVIGNLIFGRGHANATTAMKFLHSSLAMTDIYYTSANHIKSDAGGFAVSMVGQAFRIASGTHFTPGTYTIQSFVSGNEIVLATTPASEDTSAHKNAVGYLAEPYVINIRDNVIADTTNTLKWDYGMAFQTSASNSYYTANFSNNYVGDTTPTTGYAFSSGNTAIGNPTLYFQGDRLFGYLSADDGPWDGNTPGTETGVPLYANNAGKPALDLGNMVSQTIQNLTVTDATATLTARSGYVYIYAGKDPTCTLTIAETGLSGGEILTIVSHKDSPYSLVIQDIDGQVECKGDTDLTLASKTSASFIYASDRWVQVGGSADGSLGTPASGILTNCTFPTLNQNTSGTAANLSGTPALPNGTTATTQAAGTNNTSLATTAYVDVIGASTIAYGTGTVWTVDCSGTRVAVDFGTTDPAITIPSTGVWELTYWLTPKGESAAWTGQKTFSSCIRKTSGTPADVANSLVYGYTQANSSAIIATYNLCVTGFPTVEVTATAGDTYAIYAGIDAALDSGTFTVINAGLRAKRIR